MTLDDMTALINARAKGRIKGSVRLEMPDLGTIYVDEKGVQNTDAHSDLTLTAKSQVFHDIATGKENAAKAFMLRKLRVDGNPMRALKIGDILSSDA